MSAFRIVSPQKENITLTNEVPAAFDNYKLAGATSLVAAGNYGHMLFHHFKGQAFDIWYSNYLMKQTCAFEGEVDKPILELRIPFINSFEASWDGLPQASLHHHQFEITYSPYTNTKAAFNGGTNYHTFDIHIGQLLLQEYAIDCRKMAMLMERIEKKPTHPVNMLDIPQFISLEMVRIIRAIVGYNLKESLAPRFFNALVQELLVLLTSQTAQLTDKPKFSLADVNKAQEVHKLILSDFELYDTVKQLAAKVDMPELRLQLAFKHLYGTTVAKFSREARLEKSYILLQANKYPIRTICLMVGYDDAANYSVAFKNHYGFWPGAVQKRLKQ